MDLKKESDTHIFYLFLLLHYTLFGCFELGLESGIVEFGSEFRRLEGPGNLVWNSDRFPDGAPALNRYAHQVSDPRTSEFAWNR
jgi:hypothetical protein